MENNQFRSGFNGGFSRSFGDNIREFVKSKSVLNRLVVINVAVFLALWLLRVLAQVLGFLVQSPLEVHFGTFVRWFSCPASFTALLHRPWSIVTALFVHSGFWHLFFNILMLIVVGRIFLEYFSEKHLLIVYFFGGICGNLLYMAAYNIFPAFSGAISDSYAVGASGSIMAIMAAITAYRPKHEINLLLLGRTSLITIAILFVMIDVISIPRGNAGGHIAHIGGFLAGLLYIAVIKNWVDDRLNRKYSGFNTKKSKYYVSKESGRPLSDEEFNARRHQENLKIDEILDKISKYGYDALSKEEKDFLFHYSKK